MHNNNQKNKALKQGETHKDSAKKNGQIAVSSSPMLAYSEGFAKLS